MDIATLTIRWLELYAQALAYKPNTTRNKSICKWDSTIYDEHWQSKQFFDLYTKVKRKYFRVYVSLAPPPRYRSMYVFVCADAVIMALTE